MKLLGYPLFVILYFFISALAFFLLTRAVHFFLDIPWYWGVLGLGSMIALLFGSFLSIALIPLIAIAAISPNEKFASVTMILVTAYLFISSSYTIWTYEDISYDDGNSVVALLGNAVLLGFAVIMIQSSRKG